MSSVITVWERFHGGVEDQAWYYRSILGAISDRDVALQKSVECAKLSDQNSGVSTQSDVQDTAPQEESSDSNDAREDSRSNGCAKPSTFQEFQQAVAYLFQEFQQAVAYLFQGETQ